MTVTYLLALLVSNVLLGAPVVWLLLRQRQQPVKKEKQEQFAKAGRDIGIQAGRDVIQHQYYYNQSEQMEPREQRLMDTINKLLGQLQEKDRQLQTAFMLKVRLMDKVERLYEVNSGLLEEVGRLKVR